MKAAAVLAVTFAMLVALAPPDAGAQAPVPKVTITGQIDNLANYISNLGENLADRQLRNSSTTHRMRRR